MSLNEKLRNMNLFCSNPWWNPGQGNGPSFVRGMYYSFDKVQVSAITMNPPRA